MKLAFCFFCLTASFFLKAESGFQLSSEEVKAPETPPETAPIVGPQAEPQVKPLESTQIESPPIVIEVPSAPGESQLVISQPNPWRGGFQFGGLGAFSTVDYEEGYSGGLGWSFGLTIEKRLNAKWRALGSFGYQSLSVARLVGSTGGPIVDPSAEFIQTQKGPFLQGMLGMPSMGGSIDFGLQYFHPTSARQTGSNSVYEFTPSKFLFIVFGPSYSMKVRGEWEVEARAWFFVNTLGTSQFKLMGGRLELALSAPL